MCNLFFFLGPKVAWGANLAYKFNTNHDCGALTLHLAFFFPLSLSFSILICVVMASSIFTFSFLLKSENTQFDRFANISYFFFSFLMKFHTFLTTHNFEKSLCSRNFLSTILQKAPLFFQRRPFFWRNCLMQSFYLQLSLLPFPFPYFFLPSFFFISLTTKQDISFQIQLIKKKCFEDINKKSLNLVRMGCKIHIFYHPIRDVTSIFYWKLSTLYHN